MFTSFFIKKEKIKRKAKGGGGCLEISKGSEGQCL
jgi:hypothetical protein